MHLGLEFGEALPWPIRAPLSIASHLPPGRDVKAIPGRPRGLEECGVSGQLPGRHRGLGPQGWRRAGGPGGAGRGMQGAAGGAGTPAV